VLPTLNAPARGSRLTSVPGVSKAGGLLGLAMVCVGLFTGLLYSFSVSVMLGLAKTDDRTFVEVMRRINTAIQNPAFGISLIGGLVFGVGAAVSEKRLGAKETTKWIVVALGLYFVALAITGGVNIPLNDRLARAGNLDSISDLHALRTSFEVPWDRANALRSVASTLALASLGRAMIMHGRENPRR
jgi:uncharacterized membrane protein